jgi:HEAT repeat protein
VEDVVARIGHDAFVQSCVDLVERREVDLQLVHALGGPPARWAVDGGAAGPDYWLRVWALRGLLWQWGDAATDAVVSALDDEAWRVREMAAKVAARHRVDEALEALLGLREDTSRRVRAAAGRAVERLTAASR